MKAKVFTALALTAGFFLPAVPCALAIPVSATFNSTDNNLAIPDNNLNGISSSITINTAIQSITSLQVTLDINGGNNGDYYAYLTDGSGIAILLNRTGASGSNPYGYSDSGFNVTFSDTAGNGNIHFYQTSPGYSVNSSGQLTGTWQPDGRNVSPTNSASVIASTSPTAGLSGFDGANPNTTWTLFVADVQPLDTGTLIDWSLTVNGNLAVGTPEVGNTLALLFLSFGALLVIARTRLNTAV